MMQDTDPKQVSCYEELCSYDNLKEAFENAQKRKTLKSYVIAFEKDLKANLLTLQNELLMQTYKPQPLKTFILRDPKTRKISKSAFRDRIVHHAIYNVTSSLFEKGFIYDSYANRIGKGPLKALERFDQFKRKVSKNNTIPCSVLKADIKQYFETVDHEILFNLLQKKIKDERILWLIQQILKNHQGNVPGKGMPLGNLTSQFWANVYLNELDQFVKHKLRAKHYVRYVDDFVILHESSHVLEAYKRRIDEFLQSALCLKLHPDKSQVLRLEEGIGFLGFKVFYYHKLIRKKNLRKFDRRWKEMQDFYKEGAIEREKVVEKFEGWLAYTSHGNTYKYRKQLTRSFNQAFPFQNTMEIVHLKKHENLSRNIEASKFEFSIQKTLLLFKKGLTLPQIAELRQMKEATVWQHLATLIEYHQLRLKEVMPTNRVKKILAQIKSPNDTLKEIRARLQDESITYNEINCVLANLKGKQKEKSIHYFIHWYQKTNCLRKCFFNKEQREECRLKMQKLETQCCEMQFTKKDFLHFFNESTTICVLPEEEKRVFISWREFRAERERERERRICDFDILQIPISKLGSR